MLLDDFANRFAPGGDLGIFGHRKRRNFPFAMARYAMGLYQSGDLLAVGDRGFVPRRHLPRLGRAADVAAHGGCFGHAHILAGQQFF